MQFSIARIMHRFSTAAVKPSGLLHRLRDPQAGASGHAPRLRFVTRTSASSRLGQNSPSASKTLLPPTAVITTLSSPISSSGTLM